MLTGLQELSFATIHPPFLLYQSSLLLLDRAISVRILLQYTPASNRRPNLLHRTSLSSCYCIFSSPSPCNLKHVPTAPLSFLPSCSPLILFNCISTPTLSLKRLSAGSRVIMALMNSVCPPLSLPHLTSQQQYLLFEIRVHPMDKSTWLRLSWTSRLFQPSAECPQVTDRPLVPFTLPGHFLTFFAGSGF